MYVERTLTARLQRRMFGGKVLIVQGPRQAGKTTAIKRLLESTVPQGYSSFNGDLPDDRALLVDATPVRLQALLGQKKVLLIDEAQRIPDIGLVLKRMVDTCPEIQLIVSGSSSFELANHTNEPLTGRKFEFTLLPLSFSELAHHTDVVLERRELERRLLFGAYPEIATHPEDATERLRMLSGSYLYKDILALGAIRHSETLDKLIRALAFQCGSEVSFRELAALAGADGKTVDRYVDLLVKCHVLFVLPSYTRNHRNELRKGKKIYFIDCGIRNAVIGNFLPLSSRNDVGAMWENYLMAERQKWRLENAPDTRAFFWRTKDQEEVDLVEESALGLAAFEFKWNARRKARAPKSFPEAYPEAAFHVITPENYDTFLFP